MVFVARESNDQRVLVYKQLDTAVASSEFKLTVEERYATDRAIVRLLQRFFWYPLKIYIASVWLSQAGGLHC